MKPLSTERPTQLRLNVPARPPIPTPTTTITSSSSLRHYPSYPYTPSSSSAKPYPFSPLPTPTPSKRPGVKPWLPWLCTLLYISSLYWLNTTLDPNISSVPFTFLALLLSAVVTAISHRQLSRNRPLTLSQRGTLAADGAMLAAVFFLRFSGCRACGPMEAILAEFAGALVGKSLLEAAKPPHRGKKIRGLAALATGVILLSQGFDRAGCFLGGLGFSDRTACSRVFRLVAPLSAGFIASLEKSWAGRSHVRNLGKRRIRLISLSIAAAILYPFAMISFFLRDSNSGPLYSSSALWPLIGAVAVGVVSSFYGETYCEEKLLMPSMSPKPYSMTICCLFILELVFGLELSLLGFVLISFILWIAVRDLGSPSGMFNSILESDPSEAFSSLVKNPLHHILSERKSKKIAIFLLINTAFMAVEFVFGFMSNSLGLISDACHMLFDCAALAIGLYASYISRLPANGKFNYGYGRFEVLSGYVNAVFLVLVGSLIVLESLERILDPQEISTESLLIVSVGGLLVNIVGLVFFHEEHHYAHSHGSSCSHGQSHDGHSHEHIHDCVSQSHSHTCTIKTEPHSLHDHCSVNCQGNRSSSSVQLDAHRDAQVILTEDHQVPHIHMCHEEHKVSAQLHEHEEHSHPSAHDHLIQGEHQQRLHDHSDKRDNSMHNDITKGACSHPHKGNGEEHHHSHEHNNSHSHCLEHSLTHAHSRHGHSHSTNLHSGDSHSDGHNHSHSHSDLEHSCSLSGHGHSHSVHGHLHSGHSHSEEHSQSYDHFDLEHKQSHSGHSQSTKPQKLKDHHHIDHNMEGIFLHVLADTLGSVGVVASTLLIKYKGWLIADPACSIFISFLIVSSVIPLLRNAAEILLQRVPRANEHDIKQAFKDIQKIQGVHDFQNMHVWSFTNKEVVGTLHLHIYSGSDKIFIGTQVAHVLHDAGIKDLTLQMEYVGNS